MEVAAEISKASLYVACMTLNSEVLQIPKKAISCSPFDSKYGVSVNFEQGTFAENTATVEFKMNVFSEKACKELSCHGIQPFPVLHLSEVSRRQPQKTVIATFQMNGPLKRDEELLVLFGDFNEINNETEIPFHEIRNGCVSVELNRFSGVSPVKVKRRRWNRKSVIKILKKFAVAPYSVTFSSYHKQSDCREVLYRVGCCDGCNIEKLNKIMLRDSFTVMQTTVASLYNNTSMRVELDGCYEIVNNSVELDFVKDEPMSTRDFKIFQNEEASEDASTNFLFLKEGDDQSFTTMVFCIPNKGASKQSGNSKSYADGNPTDVLPCKCWFPVSSDQQEITVLLDDRELMTQIADSLEQNPGIYLQDLALAFNVDDPSQLKSVEPARNFLNHLAHNNGDITLSELKRLIEHGLHLKRKSIFPSIERAITDGRVRFMMESTLAEVSKDGKSWLYLLENLADKLLENTFQLPSWKDVAGHYGYVQGEIDRFCTNVPDERPTVKLFKHLSFREDVPTIAALKSNLQRVNRNDMVKVIDRRLLKTSEHIAN